MPRQMRPVRSAAINRYWIHFVAIAGRKMSSIHLRFTGEAGSDCLPSWLMEGSHCASSSDMDFDKARPPIFDSLLSCLSPRRRR